MNTTIFGLPVLTIMFILGVPLAIAAALAAWGFAYRPGADDPTESNE